MNDEKELAKAALELLKRTDIKGGEVPVFVAVNNWLQALIDGTPPAS